MTRPRVEVSRLRELIRLHRSGSRSARDVARLLRMGPRTERQYRTVLATAGLLAGPVDRLPALEEVATAVRSALPPAAPLPAPIDPWRSQIAELTRKGLSAAAIFDRLRVEPAPGLGAFAGSYSAVKRARARLAREQAAAAADVAVPIPTQPGLEAQVDFGYAGRFYDPASGVLRRAWVFVMLLCHSRLMFVRLVFDQRIETWLRLHEEAFQAFGGCPRTVVPDNTRRAVLRAAFGLDGQSELERSYRELAGAWGFTIDPAPPGDPRKRGKVEASVKYVLRNGLAGREGTPLDGADAALQVWNREVASKRRHGTTGHQPVEVFEAEERGALLRPPEGPVVRTVWRRATVHPDCHVTCRGRLFSVPWQLVHDTVWIRACGSSIEVFHRDHRVAGHVDGGLRRTTLDEHLPDDRRELRHRGQVYWEARAAKIGIEALTLVRAVFARDGALSQLRQVQAIVRHLERHPRARAEAASCLVLRGQERSFQAVKHVLANALDQHDGRSRRSTLADSRRCSGGLRVRKRRTAARLLSDVQELFFREILTFEGERHVGMRIDGRWPDRSVFAVAWLDTCESAVVARVYEADLDLASDQALQIVYMAMEDLALAQTTLQPVRNERKAAFGRRRPSARPKAGRDRRRPREAP